MSKFYRRLFILTIGALSFFLSGAALTGNPDPLPSWRDTAPKQAVIEFVTRVTNAKSTGYVPPPERIAVFDNDGTLWSEQPLYTQLFFAIDRVRQMAPQHPEWKTQEPFASALKGDLAGVVAQGEKGLGKLVLATHANTTSEEFTHIVRTWLQTARNPATKRLYTDMVYQPMLELIRYLQSNQFKVFIVTGGGSDMVRAFSEEIYNIPPEQVIGSNLKAQWQVTEGKPAVVRKPEGSFYNDKENKPIAIQQAIGRRPVMAFGNSDGDLQMLQWTTAGSGPRFGLIVHHTDAEREWAYDRASKVGKLDRALDEAPQHSWIIVDMKKDWEKIFP